MQDLSRFSRNSKVNKFFIVKNLEDIFQLHFNDLPLSTGLMYSSNKMQDI